MQKNLNNSDTYRFEVYFCLTTHMGIQTIDCPSNHVQLLYFNFLIYCPSAVYNFNNTTKKTVKMLPYLKFTCTYFCLLLCKDLGLLDLRYVQ